MTVTVTDVAGNDSVDTSSSELTIDLTAPVAPTVTMSLTNAAAPTIEGTVTLGAGETLTVNVDGVTYVAGDGALVDNGDGTWTLTIPADSPIAEGLHDVTATVTDAAGNASVDVTSGELTDRPDTTAGTGRDQPDDRRAHPRDRGHGGDRRRNDADGRGGRRSLRRGGRAAGERRRRHVEPDDPGRAGACGRSCTR